MSDATSAANFDGVAGHIDHHTNRGTLTTEKIEEVLATFRDWLTEYREPDEIPAEPVPFDWSSIVAQVTALRHEVNLQTKASRTATERIGEVLAKFDDSSAEESTSNPTPPEMLRPVVKTLLGIRDALMASHVQALRMVDSAAEVAAPPVRVGFFAKLWGNKTPLPTDDRLRRFAKAAADGYAISLRRIDDVLPTLGLEAIPALGELFDPETMEAIALADEGPPNTVVEELQPGFTWHGQVFRFAQVKVARTPLTLLEPE